MTVTICYITGNQIDKATTKYTWETRDDRYDTLLDRDLSVEGMAQLNAAVQEEMEGKAEFAFMDHKRARREHLESLTG